MLYDKQGFQHELYLFCRLVDKLYRKTLKIYILYFLDKLIINLDKRVLGLFDQINNLFIKDILWKRGSFSKDFYKFNFLVQSLTLKTILIDCCFTANQIICQSFMKHVQVAMIVLDIKVYAYVDLVLLFEILKLNVVKYSFSFA